MDLSLPHETINISALLPKVQAAIEGIDQNLAAEYLMDAAIEFAKASHVMRKTLCIDVIPCVTSYSLDMDPYRKFEVRKVVHDLGTCQSNNDMSGKIYVEGNTLYLEEEPQQQHAGSTVTIEFIVTPKRSSDVIPMDLYEDWEPAIINMALSNLYLMSGTTWGNKGLSDRTRQLYSEYVSRAKFINTTKHKPVSLRLGPKRRPR